MASALSDGLCSIKDVRTLQDSRRSAMRRLRSNCLRFAYILPAATIPCIKHHYISVNIQVIFNL